MVVRMAIRLGWVCAAAVAMAAVWMNWRRVSMSGSPESRFVWRLIADGEMRCVEALLSGVQAVDARGGEAGGQQRSFHGIGGLAGKVHLLDVIDERAEEVGQRGAAVGHGQVHLGGPGIAMAIDVGGEIEVADQA